MINGWWTVISSLIAYILYACKQEEHWASVSLYTTNLILICGCFLRRTRKMFFQMFFLIVLFIIALQSKLCFSNFKARSYSCTCMLITVILSIIIFLPFFIVWIMFTSMFFMFYLIRRLFFPLDVLTISQSFNGYNFIDCLSFVLFL